MKIPTAIEILELNIKEAGKKMPPDTLDALKLGVEALIFYQELHRTPGINIQLHLPGETPEGESP